MRLSPTDYDSLVLLAMNGLALGVGVIILSWVWALHRRARRLAEAARHVHPPIPVVPRFPQRPLAWLAVRSATPEAVQAALGLSRFAPCPWTEGISGSHEFFISPPVHGWVIVTGLGLPNPTHDVDATFLFLLALSRKLGHVEFFYADRVLHHHGWARLDEGCVTRAYAWTGETVWNQGGQTLSEIELGMKCSGYGEPAAAFTDTAENFEKVPLLAARWSLDPAEVRAQFLQQAIGIAGESAGMN